MDLADINILIIYNNMIINHFGFFFFFKDINIFIQQVSRTHSIVKKKKKYNITKVFYFK